MFMVFSQTRTNKPIKPGFIPPIPNMINKPTTIKLAHTNMFSRLQNPTKCYSCGK